MTFAAVPCKADEKEMIRLMAQYGPSLKRMCCLYLKDAALAEDAAQETFITAWRHLPQLAQVNNEQVWLLRIAVNTCRDMQRTGWFRRVDRHVTPEALPLTAAPEEGHPLLAEAVMNLAPRCREIILLYYYQGMKTQEIAQAPDMSVNTVKSRLLRARKLLREQLEGGWIYD